MQPFLFFRACSPKGKSWSQEFLAETVETGGKNRNVTENPFILCEECYRKITAKDVEIFWNGAVNEFYRLKALITLERVST